VHANVVVYLANQTAKSVLGPSAWVDDSISLYKVKGGFPGGTLASVISSLEGVPRKLSDGVTKDFSYREREWVSSQSGHATRMQTQLKQGGLPANP